MLHGPSWIYVKGNKPNNLDERGMKSVCLGGD